MRVICNRCGSVCETNLSEDLVNRFLEQGQDFPYLCSVCFENVEQERMEQEEREIQREHEDEVRLYQAVVASGVRPGYAVTKPYVPYVYEWIKEHISEDLLLSGETGTGKSTSAGCAVRDLIIAGRTVGVYYMSELLDRWREVRCNNDNPIAIKKLFAEIESNDYLIIDEVAGKTVNTDSTREFMFRLLEDRASGYCNARVWLLGNFFKGSVADTFGDEAPAMRRIRENFTCGRIDKTKQAVVPIFKR